MLGDNKEIYGVIEGRWVLEIDPRMSIVLVKLPMSEKKLKQLKSSIACSTLSQIKARVHYLNIRPTEFYYAQVLQVSNPRK